MKLSRKKSLFFLCTVIVVAFLSFTAFADNGEAAIQSNFYSTFWSLVPPVLAIALALITKEVYSSLFIGIVVAALFNTNFAVVPAIDTVVSTGIVAAVSGSAGIFAFLVILGIMVALINKAGGSAAFGAWAQKNIKSRVGAMLATFALGVFIFIDDYFNCLTVGSVMMPVTDSHKISRSKLSYLIDATAAPICMIAPISSWACAVAVAVSGTKIEEAGIGGLTLFVRAIPYNFYSLLTLVFVIAICIMKFDYGPMAKHERNAVENGDLFSSDDRITGEVIVPSSKGHVIDLLFPVITLVISCIIGLIYSGGFFDGAGFIEAFENCDSTFGLPWGALISLVITIVYFMIRRVINFKEAMECVPQGFTAMVPALLILTFATALKNITNELGANIFVKSIVEGSSLVTLLPAVIFLVAVALSFATGTSWGTFSILIPIVASVFDVNSELMTIGISACLAGAVCGDHCSPISDTTIMASAGAKCNHVNHVSTQLPYAMTVAGISFICYILAGFIQSAWVMLPLGAVITIGTLFTLKKFTKSA